MHSPPKKAWAHCLVVCSRSDPLQLSESRWSHYSWEVCSANWWDAQKNRNAYSQHWPTERAQLFSMTMPDHMLRNQCFRSWASWAMKFFLICHILLTSHQPTNTTSSNLTTFCMENSSTTHRIQKILSKRVSNPKARCFTLQKETNLFLVGKKTLIIMVPILINKDVFEPNYNDLKFMVWNCNYFCTNLIILCLLSSETFYSKFELGQYKFITISGKLTKCRA